MSTLLAARSTTVARAASRRLSSCARRLADSKVVIAKPIVLPPAIPAPKPKKRFSFAKFVAATAVLGAAGYGGLLYTATKSDRAMDFVLDKQLPYSEEIIDFIEKGSFDDVRSYFDNLGKQAKKLELKLPSKDQINEITQKGEHLFEETKKKLSHKDEHKITPAEQLQKPPETVHKPPEHLPLIVLSHKTPSAVDSAVQSTVDSFNDLIRSIDIGAQNTPHKETLVKTISANVTALAQKLDSLTANFDKELQEQLKVSHTDLMASYTKKELELTESLLYQYNKEKQQLEEKLTAQLENEINASKEAISLAAVNAVTMMRVEQTRQFEKLIKQKIDEERDGRLANLKALNDKVKELEQFSVSLESQLVSNHNKALLVKSVTNLKNALGSSSESDSPKLLSQYVDNIAKVAKSIDNELINLALRELQPLAAKESTHTVLTTSQLLTAWEELSPELRSSSLLPPNAGLLGHLSSILFSKLLFPVKGAKPNGKDIESVIARIDASLARGDLDVAVEEAANLKGWPRKLADDWVKHGRKRLEIQFLADVIDSESRIL